jgi:hypothetical protein
VDPVLTPKDPTMKRRRPRPTGHNYLPAVLAFVAQHEFRPGKVHPIGVFHDSWCGVFRGGRCDCDPDVKPLTCPPGSPETN